MAAERFVKGPVDREDGIAKTSLSNNFLRMLYVEHYRTVSFAYLMLRRNIRQASI